MLGELRGQRVLGTRSVERALPVGAAVTAVGELVAVADYKAGFQVRCVLRAGLETGVRTIGSPTEGHAATASCWSARAVKEPATWRVDATTQPGLNVWKAEWAPAPAAQGALRSHGKMYVLRAPKAGGPFVISRQALPDLVASLRATSASCSRAALVFTSLGAGLLLLSAAQYALRQWHLKTFRCAASGLGGARPSVLGAPKETAI